MIGKTYRGGSGLYRARLVIGLVLMAGLLVAGLASLGSARVEAQEAREQTLPLDSVVATIINTSLREQPADSPAITQMPVNSRAIIVGGPFNDGWYWLDYNMVRGYVQGRALVLVDDKYTPVPAQTATATSTKVPPSSTAVPTATATPTPDGQVPTTEGVYTGLWIGEMSSGGNVRTGPGLDQRVLKGWPAGRRVLLFQQARDSKGGIWYRVSDPPEEPMYVHSSLIRKVMPVVYEGAKYKGKWININITQQVVTAYQDGTPVKVTLTSTGKGDNPTELGVWKIYLRVPIQDMEGGNKASGDYYNLKDVPWVQYFHTSGEGLHGTYWHDNFGRPMSHGCINLSTPIAKWFYDFGHLGMIVYAHN